MLWIGDCDSVVIVKIRRPTGSTQGWTSAASDVSKGQGHYRGIGVVQPSGPALGLEEIRWRRLHNLNRGPIVDIPKEIGDQHPRTKSKIC